MGFHPKALLVLVGSALLLTLALSSDGGDWFHVGEVISTIIIVLSLVGFLRRGRLRSQ